MTMMLVRDGDREAHVALERDGRVYSYDNHTQAFHLNRGLTLDYFTEGTLQYEVLDEAGAAAAVARGVGKLDKRTMGWLVERHLQDTNAIPLAEALPVAVPTSSRADTRARAQAVVRLLASSPAGNWVDWRTYAGDRRQTAYVAASDLRKGKNKVLAEAGMLEASVVQERGKYVVKVRRPPIVSPHPAHATRAALSATSTDTFTEAADQRSTNEGR